MVKRLTPNMRDALRWIASRGDMRRGRYNDFIYDTISGKTAGALEMMGLVERRYTSADDARVYVTAKGLALAETLDPVDE